MEIEKCRMRGPREVVAGSERAASGRKRGKEKQQIRCQAFTHLTRELKPDGTKQTRKKNDENEKKSARRQIKPGDDFPAEIRGERIAR